MSEDELIRELTAAVRQADVTKRDPVRHQDILMPETATNRTLAVTKRMAIVWRRDPPIDAARALKDRGGR